jgi:hypothetical protein
MTTEELISKIQDKHNKQKDIIADYAVAISLYIDKRNAFDWTAINNAIIDRWSRSALQRIKKAAWAIV